MALPESLSALTRLRTLDVSRNLLTVLPAGLGLAAALDRAAAHHNPLLAPPPEILRRPAAAAVAYLRGVHVARSTGRLDWNGLGLMTADTLPVMLPDGALGLVREVHVDGNLLVVLHPAVLAELPCLEVPTPPRHHRPAPPPPLRCHSPCLQRVPCGQSRQGRPGDCWRLQEPRTCPARRPSLAITG